MAGGLTQAFLDFMAQYGYLAVFVFMFLETSMVFPFAPSEVVVPFAAGVMVHNPVTVVAFALAAAAGATVGSLFAYYLFGTAGQLALDRYGRYIHVSENEIERGQRWFTRWGESLVFWGRLLPVLRSIISIPAGLARMSVRKFTLYSATGAFVFNAGIAGLVYYGKTRSIYQFVFETMRAALASLVRYSASHPLVLGAIVSIVALGSLLLYRNLP